MNSNLQPSPFRRSGVHVPRPPGRTVARSQTFPLLLAILCLLLGTSCSSTSEPLFNDFPTPQPATNFLSGSATNRTGSALAPGVTNAAGQTSTNSMDALNDKYRLAVGDRISFRIEEDEEEPKSITVTDSGEVEVPYIGRYSAAGKTCKELAQALKVELEKQYYYRATVIIAVDAMTKSRGKVYLVGAVRAPGPQEIPSDEVFTLSKAVLRAGGFTDFADKRNVKVTRQGSYAGMEEQTFIVNVADILEKGKIDSDPTLQPGDLIYIPERLVRF